MASTVALTASWKVAPSVFRRLEQFDQVVDFALHQVASVGLCAGFGPEVMVFVPAVCGAHALRKVVVGMTIFSFGRAPLTFLLKPEKIRGGFVMRMCGALKMRQSGDQQVSSVSGARGFLLCSPHTCWRRMMGCAARRQVCSQAPCVYFGCGCAKGDGTVSKLCWAASRAVSAYKGGGGSFRAGAESGG